jgi:hypothetical protein
MGEGCGPMGSLQAGCGEEAWLGRTERSSGEVALFRAQEGAMLFMRSCFLSLGSQMRGFHTVFSS